MIKYTRVRGPGGVSIELPIVSPKAEPAREIFDSKDYESMTDELLREQLLIIMNIAQNRKLIDWEAAYLLDLSKEAKLRMELMNQIVQDGVIRNAILKELPDAKNKRPRA